MTEIRRRFPRQSPIQERANVRIDPDHFETGEIAHAGEWFLRGGHQAILRVAVNEDLDGFSGGDVVRRVTAWEQDLALLTAIQVQARWGLPDSAETTDFSNDRHLLSA